MATWPAFLSFFLSSRRLRVALPWVCPGETLAVLSGVALLAIVASGVSRNHSLPHSSAVIAARAWHMRGVQRIRRGGDQA